MTQALENLKESFFQNEFTTFDDFNSNIDHRINSKIAHGMKKATQLIVKSFDKHFQNRLQIVLE